MARSHHRKKHKEHLRQFKNKGDTVSTTPKTKASGIFTAAGAVIGLAVTYFGTEGSIFWILVGVIAGGTAGFFIGRGIDKE